MYETICGINVDEDNPGFEKIILRPQPDKRLKWAKASLDTAYGTITSGWRYEDDEIVYDFDLPKPAQIHLEGEIFTADAGKHTFRYSLVQ